MIIDSFEDPSGSDPANWDCCDEHQTVFWKGDSCEQCEAERAQAEEWDREYSAKIEAQEIAEAQRIEAEENERTEREDCGWY